MKLESEKTWIGKPQKKCYDFLVNPKNYEQLMPESTEKFELNTAGGFDFQLKGMPEIRLKMAGTKPNKKIVLGSNSPKFEFNLTVLIQSLTEEKSEVQFFFDGNFNAVMAMMVKPPLKKFIATLGENLKKTNE